MQFLVTICSGTWGFLCGGICLSANGGDCGGSCTNVADKQSSIDIAGNVLTEGDYVDLDIRDIAAAMTNAAEAYNHVFGDFP
jgi:hypothetical protein